MKCTCDCDVCKSGEPMPISQWVKLSDTHQQIYAEIIAAVGDGTVQIQGA